MLPNIPATPTSALNYCLYIVSAPIYAMSPPGCLLWISYLPRSIPARSSIPFSIYENFFLPVVQVEHLDLVSYLPHLNHHQQMLSAPSSQYTQNRITIHSLHHYYPNHYHVSTKLFVTAFSIYTLLVHSLFYKEQTK